MKFNYYSEVIIVSNNVHKKLGVPNIAIEMQHVYIQNSKEIKVLKNQFDLVINETTENMLQNKENVVFVVVVVLQFLDELFFNLSQILNDFEIWQYGLLDVLAYPEDQQNLI